MSFFQVRNNCVCTIKFKYMNASWYNVCNVQSITVRHNILHRYVYYIVFKNRVRSPDVQNSGVGTVRSFKTIIIIFVLQPNVRPSTVNTYSVVHNKTCNFIFQPYIRSLYIHLYVCNVLMVTLNRHILHVYLYRRPGLHGLINIEWIYVRTRYLSHNIIYMYDVYTHTAAVWAEGINYI